MKKVRKILFVCTGNTCRSPSAEMIMKSISRKRKLRLSVGSAGINADVGSPISENSAVALAKHGVKVGKFSARQLTFEMMRENQLVITMSNSHITAIGGRFDNLFSFEQITGKAVADPYGQPLDVYLKTIAQLVSACNLLADKIADINNAVDEETRLDKERRNRERELKKQKKASKPSASKASHETAPSHETPHN